MGAPSGFEYEGSISMPTDSRALTPSKRSAFTSPITNGGADDLAHVYLANFNVHSDFAAVRQSVDALALGV